MVDIEWMCTSEGCPMENTCYRKKAIASPFWQAYGENEYDEDGCDDYILYDAEKEELINE